MLKIENLMELQFPWVGNADLNKCFTLLKKYNYQGNFSLQTARDKSGNHVEVMLKYYNIVKEHLNASKKGNVLITGSSSGLGYLANCFVKDGYPVLLMVNRIKKLIMLKIY